MNKNTKTGKLGHNQNTEYHNYTRVQGTMYIKSMSHDAFLDFIYIHKNMMELSNFRVVTPSPFQCQNFISIFIDLS